MFFIIYEMYFLGIFNYFVIFNHGLCNFLDRVTVWKPVSVLYRGKWIDGLFVRERILGDKNKIK